MLRFISHYFLFSEENVRNEICYLTILFAFLPNEDKYFPQCLLSLVIVFINGQFMYRYAVDLKLIQNNNACKQ